MEWNREFNAAIDDIRVALASAPSPGADLRESDMRRILDKYDVEHCQNEIVRELMVLSASPSAPSAGVRE